MELVFPSELETCLAHGVIPVVSSGVSLGKVGGVGGEFEGNHAFFHVVPVRQSEVFLLGHVAEHGCPEPADHGTTDGGGDVVVTGGDVRHERSEGVERGFVTPFLFQSHILPDFLHRHVSRSLDDHLHVMLGGHPGQFSQRFQLGKLGLVVRVGDATGTQPVTDGHPDVIFGENLADFLEMLVQETFPLVGRTPVRHDGSPAGHDSREAFQRQRHVVPAQPGMDREIVHALLGLFDKRVTVNFPREVFHLAPHLFQCLVQRHGSHGYGRVTDDPFACLVDVFPGRQVHDRVGSPAEGPHGFFHFLGNRRGDGGIPDVGVDLHEEVTSDDHRLALRVVDIRGDDGPSGGHFLTHEFRGDILREVRAQRLAFLFLVSLPDLVDHLVLADGDVFHFRGNHPLAGVVHL